MSTIGRAAIPPDPSARPGPQNSPTAARVTPRSRAFWRPKTTRRKQPRPARQNLRALDPRPRPFAPARPCGTRPKRRASPQGTTPGRIARFATAPACTRCPDRRTAAPWQRRVKSAKMRFSRHLLVLLPFFLRGPPLQGRFPVSAFPKLCSDPFRPPLAPPLYPTVPSPAHADIPPCPSPPIPRKNGQIISPIPQLMLNIILPFTGGCTIPDRNDGMDPFLSCTPPSKEG